MASPSETDSIAARVREFLSAQRDYALLIDGPWGIGKTHYCRTILFPIAQEVTKRPPLYVSLFGVSSAEDFDRRIVEAIAPLLVKKGAKAAINTLRGLGRKWLGLDVDYGDLVDIVTRRTIFIDDLERCEMSIREVFGYVDNLITRYSINAILIGNEREFSKGKEEYGEWKEKLVGFTYRYHADLKAVSRALIKATFDRIPSLSWSQPVIEREYEAVLVATGTETSPNFRTLKVAVDLWLVVAKELPPQTDETREAIRLTARLLISLVTATRRNEADWVPLMEAFSPSFEMSLFMFNVAATRDGAESQGGTAEPDVLAEFISHYLKAAPADIFRLRELPSLIRTGRFSSEKFAEQFADLVEALKEAPPPPLSRRIRQDLFSLDDQQVKQAATELLDSLKSHTITNLAALVGTTDSLVYLAENKLIEQTEQEIVELGKKSLEWLEATGKAETAGTTFEDFELRSLGQQTKELQRLAIEAARRISDKQQAQAWESVFQDVEREGHTFEDISERNIGKPVFAQIPPQLVIDSITGMTARKLIQLRAAMRRRYEYENVRDFLLSEWENLTLIAEQLTKAADAGPNPRPLRLFALKQVAEEFERAAKRLAPK